MSINGSFLRSVEVRQEVEDGPSVLYTKVPLAEGQVVGVVHKDPSSNDANALLLLSLIRPIKQDEQASNINIHVRHLNSKVFFETCREVPEGVVLISDACVHTSLVTTHQSIQQEETDGDQPGELLIGECPPQPDAHGQISSGEPLNAKPPQPNDIAKLCKRRSLGCLLPLLQPSNTNPSEDRPKEDQQPHQPPSSTTTTTGKRPRKQNAQFIRKRSWRKSSCSSASSVSSGSYSPTRPLLSFGLSEPAPNLFERKSEERHCSSTTSSSSHQSKQQVARPSSAGANNSVYPVSGRLSHYIHRCVQCSKSFTSASGLKQHSHIHCSSKPFRCNICNKAYTQFSNLCRHRKTHLFNERFTCRHCSQPFRNQSSLAKHRSLCPNNTNTTQSSTNPEVQMASTLYNPHLLNYSNLSSSGVSLSTGQPGGPQQPTTPNNLMLHLNSSKAPRPSLIHPFQTPSLPPYWPHLLNLAALNLASTNSNTSNHLAMLNHNLNQNPIGLFNTGSTSNIYNQITPGSKNLLELSLLAQHYYNQLGSNAGGHPGTLQPPTLKPSVSHGGNSDGESSPRSYDHPSPPNRKTSLSNFSTDSILGLNHSFEHQNQQVSGSGGSQEHVLDLSGCSGQTNNQGQCSLLSSSSNQDMEVDNEHMRSSNHKDGPEMGQPPGDSLLMIAGSRRIPQESYQNHQKDPLALNLVSEEPSQKSELTPLINPFSSNAF